MAARLHHVLTFTNRRWAMCKWGQFRAFYPKLRICMPANAVWICFSEVKKDISLKQRFYRLFDTNFGKSFISWYFCTEATFGQKWLKNSIFHYDFIILESTESRSPTTFVSIRIHRTSPFCLLLWTFGTAQLEYICAHAPTYNPSNPSWHLENALSR